MVRDDFLAEVRDFMKVTIRRQDGNIVEMEGDQADFALLFGIFLGQKISIPAASDELREAHKKPIDSQDPIRKLRKKLCRRCGIKPVEPGKGHRYCKKCARKKKPLNDTPAKGEDFEGETCVMCAEPVMPDDEIEIVNGRSVHAKCAKKMKR
jgi:hypothetical protein